ncbi:MULTISPECIES: hypothetical protein [unclassified Amycolatopsis]|uniref:hypothetical protein n=1 Tax=unclassified Amycolatopsis TaxID=2618356 RepID=UPI002875E8F5|nr:MULTISPECIES: hypothetical protein [unclassified Amycolatopsis]MDS0134070.1 hypothetical protein [Amycolatopsis sp. 505]MDS0144946.1 hypothetical protein [Amycolatopsis sp. CM201R]
MGKHSRRKSGYLPKVAAGAAPVALLFAAPAAALASPAEVTLPIDHRDDSTFRRDVATSGEDGSSVVRETLTTTRHDFLAKEIAGAVLTNDLAESAITRREERQTETTAASQEAESLARAGRHTLRLGDVRAVTANNQRLGQGASRDLSLAPLGGGAEHRIGLGEGTSHGIWPADGVDVLSQNAEQLDTGLYGTFAGDLQGALSARRSSGQAVDVGRLGAVGATSEQHATGQITGVLDVGQRHEAGGQLGPAWGLVTTSQSVGPAGPAGSIRGDLGVDHVIHAEGGTTSVRGTLDRSVALSALDRPVLGF